MLYHHCGVKQHTATFRHTNNAGCFSSRLSAIVDKPMLHLVNATAEDSLPYYAVCPPWVSGYLLSDIYLMKLQSKTLSKQTGYSTQLLAVIHASAATHLLFFHRLIPIFIHQNLKYKPSASHMLLQHMDLTNLVRGESLYVRH